MLPKVIIHNSISIDGSLTNFEPNMQLHYQLAGSFKANMHLIGSNTARTGIDMFMETIPREKEEDFRKPDKEGMLWAIPDSTGKLKGLLHVLRQSEYCKDVVVFVSKETPVDYISYLKERNYDYHIIGKNKCDIKGVLELLNEKYEVKTLLIDTGCILGNILLEQRLVSQISLLVHPIIVGKRSYNMFSNIKDCLKVNLIKKVLLEKNFIWLVYELNT